MKKTFSYFMLFLSLISCHTGIQPEAGKTVFRYNETAGITSLDPAFARNQANIWAVNHLYNGLVELDSTLNVKPAIAKSWEITESGLKYTFHLRSDIRFHKNEVFGEAGSRKLVANDVVYSLKRLANEKLASPGAWVLNQVRKVNTVPDIAAVDDSTLVIRLTKPFPPFLGMLSMQYCSVVPHEAVEYYGSEFRSHPVGTGPFKFAMWKEGVKLVLLKNPDYFEFENNIRLPFLDAVAVSFIIDKQSVFLEFIKGNLDFMSGLDASYKDELLTSSGRLSPAYSSKIQLITQPYLNTEYLGFIVDSASAAMKGSPLLKKEIRQAINYSFDRRRMIRYLRNGIGLPGLNGFIPAGLPGFGCEGYSYNPAKTRALLAQAGYPEGQGLPPITLSTNASYLDLCQFIQSQLGECGINLKIDVSPPATLRENIAQVRVPFFRGSWIADYPDAENYLSLFVASNKSPEGPNFFHYESAIFEKWYTQAMAISDMQQRAAIYKRMDSLAMQEAPVVILFYDQVLRFTRKNIAGLGSNPLNLLNLKRVKKIQDEPF